jgi:hypothetical protein
MKSSESAYKSRTRRSTVKLFYWVALLGGVLRHRYLRTQVPLG